MRLLSGRRSKFRTFEFSTDWLREFPAISTCLQLSGISRAHAWQELKIEGTSPPSDYLGHKNQADSFLLPSNRSTKSKTSKKHGKEYAKARARYPSPEY